MILAIAAVPLLHTAYVTDSVFSLMNLLWLGERVRKTGRYSNLSAPPRLRPLRSHNQKRSSTS